jgi:hypothetical protein
MSQLLHGNTGLDDDAAAGGIDLQNPIQMVDVELRSLRFIRRGPSDIRGMGMVAKAQLSCFIPDLILKGFDILSVLIHRARSNRKK